MRIRIEPEEPSASHPRQCCPAPRARRADPVVSLYLNVDYPAEYPDVIPELALEPIDEESGELRDGEEERILRELRTIVRAASHPACIRGSPDAGGRESGYGNDLHSCICRQGDPRCGRWRKMEEGEGRRGQEGSGV